MKDLYRWDNLTRPEIEKLRDEDAIVIIPLGATEQHGPHLPVGTDALTAQALAGMAARTLDETYGRRAVVAPTIAVANSIHHMSFPGTITLRPETYMRMLLEYCQCLAHPGFHKIVILNAHGGNVIPTETAIININEALGFPVYFMEHKLGGEKIFPEILETQKGGIHACEKETSMMLALYPELVDPIYKETKGGNVTKDNYPGPAKPYTFQRMEEKTDNGSVGNAYAATPEKGQRLVEVTVANVARIISEIWA